MSALFVVAALLSAPPAIDAKPANVVSFAAGERSPQEVRRDVRAALKHEASVSGPQHNAAVRQLIDLYKSLEQDSRMSAAEGRELFFTVRNRLLRISAAMERDLKKSQQSARVATSVTVLDPPVLAQQQVPVAARPQPRGAAVGGRATITPAQQGAIELIDLIQATVSPASWDVRGGPASIMNFDIGQVLVVSAPQDVHDEINALLRMLRR